MVSELSSVCVVTDRVVSQPNQALADFRAWGMSRALRAEVDEETRDQVLKHVLEAGSERDLPAWVKAILASAASA
jgi:hypothetical protein